MRSRSTSTRVVLFSTAVALVIVLGCGREKPGAGPGETGGGGGIGPAGTGGSMGTGGAAADDGGSPGEASTTPVPCPIGIKTGDPCTSGATTLGCEATRCQECIGGWRFVKEVQPVSLSCVCVAEAWSCPTIPATPPGGSIGDCVIEEPLTCDDAKDVFTDATCTDHPPCDP